MKKLTLEETRLKEEMKERCLAKGLYIDENAEAKFNMLCHLEDFEVQYWELQQENQSLKKENKILKENAENNDKVVDKVNWENQLLKKENKQLQERIEYLERSNNRREDTILEQRQEISDLEDNWNKIKEWIKVRDNIGFEKICLEDIVYEMVALEQGSDNNGNN